MFLSLAEFTNMFFVALFTMEMFLKMYSLGFQVCLHKKSSRSKIDFCVFPGLFRIFVQPV